MADRSSRSGHFYGTADILDYTTRTHAGHDESLQRTFDAPDQESMPAIQVGPSEGRLLELLCKMIGAKKAVEVGTLAGYSAQRLIAGMGEGGFLWTLEYDPRHAEVAKGNLEAAGMGERVEVIVGAALDTLPGLDDKGPFDVVFIDADKENYDQYGRWALENLRPGGLVIGDNAHLFGKLCDEDERAAAMRRFHEMVAASCDSVCIPTSDGVVVGIKR